MDFAIWNHRDRNFIELQFDILNHRRNRNFIELQFCHIESSPQSQLYRIAVRHLVELSRSQDFRIAAWHLGSSIARLSNCSLTSRLIDRNFIKLQFCHIESSRSQLYRIAVLSYWLIAIATLSNCSKTSCWIIAIATLSNCS